MICGSRFSALAQFETVFADPAFECEERRRHDCNGGNVHPLWRGFRARFWGVRHMKRIGLCASGS